MPDLPADPVVSPADTPEAIQHLVEVVQDFLSAEYPTGTDHLADAEANRLECALTEATKAVPALLGELQQLRGGRETLLRWCADPVTPHYISIADVRWALGDGEPDV